AILPWTSRAAKCYDSMRAVTARDPAPAARVLRETILRVMIASGDRLSHFPPVMPEGPLRVTDDGQPSTDETARRSGELIKAHQGLGRPVAVAARSRPRA